MVNVASKCGLTPQYEQLEALQKRYQAQGFSVLGFPCDQFLEQEPGSNDEIKTFCSVTFPMLSKGEVNGPARNPLYAQLVAAQPEAIRPAGSGFLERQVSKGRAPKAPGDILCNFEKFLIDREGKVVARFVPDMTPDDEVIRQHIE
nr:Vitamin B12 import ATP-binding protein BtuD [Candidatus Pantoea persica]